MADLSTTFHYLVKAAWFITCLLGCSYQLFSIASSYFSYDVYQKVIMIQDDVVPLPSLTVCLPFVDFIDWTQPYAVLVRPLFNNYTLRYRNRTDIKNPEDMAHFVRHNLDQGEKDSLSNKIQGLLNVKELFNISIPREDIFTRCYVVNDNSLVWSRGKCREFFIIHKFNRKYDFCYQFIPRKNSTTYVTSSINARLPRGRAYILYAVNIGKETTTRVRTSYVMLTRGDLYARFGYTPTLLFPETKGLKKITFEIYDIESLPPPFPTKCRRYKELGLQDRGHCFEECFKKISLKNLGGSIPAGPAFDATSNISFFDRRIAEDNRTYGIAIENMYKYCEVQCSQMECSVIMYVPKLLSWHDKSRAVFQVLVNQRPPVNITFARKSSLVNLVTNTTAMIGFWFGLSFFSLMKFVRDVVVFIVEEGFRLSQIYKQVSSQKAKSIKKRKCSPRKSVPSRTRSRANPSQTSTRHGNHSITRQSRKVNHATQTVSLPPRVRRKPPFRPLSPALMINSRTYDRRLIVRTMASLSQSTSQDNS